MLANIKGTTSHLSESTNNLQTEKPVSFNKFTFSEYKSLLSELTVGKKVNNAIYIHVECLELLPVQLSLLINRLIEAGNISSDHNLIKLFQSEFKVSFLSYPDFFEDPHPSLKSSITVDLTKGKFKTFDYTHHVNPPILHRKELMLPPEHPRVEEFMFLTKAEEAKGLYKDVHFIGFKKNWEVLLSEKGIAYKGHKIIPKKPSNPIVESQSVQIYRHKTAITRYNFSRPIKTLIEHNLLGETTTLLDYGCGQGDDIKGLNKMGYPVFGWDPVFYPNEKKAPTDIVNLGFVLNVIEDPSERIRTLKEAFSLSKKMLVVSTLSANTGIPGTGRLYKDGILTNKNTFQKYYFQDELQQFLEDTLDTSAVAVDLGIFYVFRSPIEHQEFLANRTKRAINWLDLSYKLFPNVREPRRSKAEILYESNKDIFDSFWNKMLELGRIPDRMEFAQYHNLIELIGSVKRVKNLYIQKFGSDILTQAVESRRNDLLVYLALSNFKKKVPFMHLPESLKLDIKAFFSTYNHAIAEGRDMLFKTGNPDLIAELCNNTKFGVLDEQALFIHKSIAQELHPVLRIYLGCAEILFGDLTVADILKIHKISGKVSLFKYDDFENKPIPILIERIKINLRDQTIKVFDHKKSSIPSMLYFKERYVVKDNLNANKLNKALSLST